MWCISAGRRLRAGWLQIGYMKQRRTDAEIANFVIGCSDASHLQDEINAIINDEPLDVGRLEPRLREAIGAVKKARVSGLGDKRLRGELNSFEQYCKSLLEIIVGRPH
jgi:hypothetical protein